ncbi:MAG: dihydrofolate reductase [Bacteroidetes bacterium]|nr:dihydrofolate reductase [Bacteroidota bacterium]
MLVSIIVAAAQNNVIGKDNALIWNLPIDMKFFKDKTKGHAVITGRKNYESIPKKFRPLPDRTNIVVTRQKNYDAQGAVVVSSIQEAIQYAKQHFENEEVFVIGGAEIYKQMLDSCDRVYLTRIHHSFDGDAFFPDLPSAWKLVDSTLVSADEKNPYSFTFQTWEK